ncbi:hypothetical protein WJX84_008974 [Apatococcus fuscideae]|uniref:Uncharacterized protein n=1 Tax=Apatococcus fuscideae TaxID=2026836 RepID=A0AAW1T2W4_9CHLO
MVPQGIRQKRALDPGTSPISSDLRLLNRWSDYGLLSVNGVSWEAEYTPVPANTRCMASRLEVDGDEVVLERVVPTVKNTGMLLRIPPGWRGMADTLADTHGPLDGLGEWRSADRWALPASCQGSCMSTSLSTTLQPAAHRYLPELFFWRDGLEHQQVDDPMRFEPDVERPGLLPMLEPQRGDADDLCRAGAFLQPEVFQGGSPTYGLFEL